MRPAAVLAVWLLVCRAVRPPGLASGHGPGIPLDKVLHHLGAQDFVSPAAEKDFVHLGAQKAQQQQAAVSTK